MFLAHFFLFQNSHMCHENDLEDSKAAKIQNEQVVNLAIKCYSIVRLFTLSVDLNDIAFMTLEMIVVAPHPISTFLHASDLANCHWTDDVYDTFSPDEQ